SAGLSYQGNLAVYGEAGGTLTPLRDGVDYTFTLASAQNFTVEFTYENLLPYSNVVITFHALINEQAQVDTGNPNTATLFFDNQTYTFTASQQANITLYQVDIEKQDAANGNGLPGAVFTLARREGGTDTTLGMVQTGDGVYRPAVGAESAQTDLTTGTAGPGQLALVGLGSGVYVLTETRAPDGYATPQGESAKTVFEIRHSESPTLVLNNNETLSANNNHFTFKILNNTGFTLPVTGGTGSLLFYGAGICVFALAIVLAVKWNKKK
ncbi:MAG: SpaA isopeptide-forming pilin-related protein, partial [Gemmiger sp.]